MSNYKALIEDLAQEDIDLLASSRSFSLASVSAQSSQASQATTPSSESRSLDSCLASSVATSVGDSDREDDCESDGDGATPVNTLNRAQPPWSPDGDINPSQHGSPIHNNIYNTLASTTSNSSSSSSGCLSQRSNASTPSTEHGFESEFSQQGTIKRKPSAPKLPLTSTTRHMLHEQERNDEVANSVSPLNNNTSNNPLNIGNLRLSLRRPVADDISSISTLKRRNSSSNTLPRGFSSKSGSNGASNTLPHKNCSALPAMPAPSIKSAEIDGLPPPLPPPEIMDSVDPETLPPPPPELLASTLSLASSLPPPPDDISPPNSDEMSCSMISLPPPPPPLSLSVNSYLQCNNLNNISCPPPPPLSSCKPKPLSPPPVAPKPRRPSDCTSPTHPLPPQPIQVRSVLQQSSPGEQKPVAPKKKRITFRDDVQNIPPSVYPQSPSPTSPCSPNKPPPPPRSESTRLSGSPQKMLPANKLTPPRAFLTNLQKVMQKKWQVAEKCKDFDQTPHEVLGFRDSLPVTETERNVGLWIQEHYGCIYDHLGNCPNNQECDGISPDNESLPSPPLPSPPPALLSPQQPSSARPVSSMSVQSNSSVGSRVSQMSGGRKKAPPPPKRADSTHLSSAGVRQ